MFRRQLKDFLSRLALFHLLRCKICISKNKRAKMTRVLTANTGRAYLLSRRTFSGARWYKIRLGNLRRLLMYGYQLIKRTGHLRPRTGPATAIILSLPSTLTRTFGQPIHAEVAEIFISVSVDGVRLQRRDLIRRSAHEISQMLLPRHPEDQANQTGRARLEARNVARQKLMATYSPTVSIVL